MAKKPEAQKPKYERRSQLRFTKEQAEQEYKWAMQAHECRVRFVEHVRIALNTRSPTRRKELYQSWREKYGDDITRSYAKYAESVYAGGDTELLKRFTEMIRDVPKPIPSYMIIGEDDGSGNLF